MSILAGCILLLIVGWAFYVLAFGGGQRSGVTDDGGNWPWFNA